MINIVESGILGEMEFRVLNGTEARAADPQGQEWPDNTEAIIAVEDEKVVGFTAWLFLPHIEGTFVVPEKRHTSLGFRLVRNMEQLLAARNISHSFAYAYDRQPEVSDYLERLGYEKIPVSVWIKPLVKETPK